MTQKQTAKRRQMKHPMKRWLIGSCLSLLCVPAALGQSAWAQSALTRAEVYRLQNIVELLRQNQAARPARVQDVMVPRDAMQTGGRSRAELLFNEGSLARIGSNSVFRFVPGTRRYQLPDGSLRSETVLQLQRGVAVIVNPPDGLGGGVSAAETPEGTVSLPPGSTFPGNIVPTSGTLPPGAVVIIFYPDLNRMTVIALTPDVVVNSRLGEQPQRLEAGQTVSVTDGQLGEVQTFDLQQFYRTSEIADVLGPEVDPAQEDFPDEVLETLVAVRVETLGVIARQQESQQEDAQGLCTLDARGRESTESTNCVTTGVDDPLNDFEDQREDSSSPPDPLPERPPAGGPNTVPDRQSVN